MGSDYFALLTDTHAGKNTEADKSLKKALKYIAKQSRTTPFDAVINAGDVTDAGVEWQYKRYVKYLKAANIDSDEFMYTVGNHDNAAGGYQKWLKKAGAKGYTKYTGTKLFRKYLNDGKMFRTEKFKNCWVITIGQGVGQKGGVYTAKAIKILKKRLKQCHEAGKVAIVVTHYAPWHGTDDKFKCIPGREEQLMGVLQSYPNVIMVVGHEHEFEQKCSVEHGFTAHNTLKTYKNATHLTYPVRLLCLNSTTRTKGNEVLSRRSTFTYNLTVADDGTITFRTNNLTKGTSKTETFKQFTTSVTVETSETTEQQVKVTFSDGKTHDGVKNGSVVTVSKGSSKAISGIPSGVKVKVTNVSSGASQTVKTTKKKASVSV